VRLLSLASQHIVLFGVRLPPFAFLSFRRPCRNCTFLTKFFKKTWKFPNKKGTFDVNLVFTATLACTKRALFITKKGTFHHKKGHF
jgi:hypothetical protein